MYGNEARHPGPPLILAPHRVPGALGGDHDDVEIGPGLDRAEMNVEAVGEEERRALFEVRGDFGLVEVGLKLVGDDAHHDVGPFGGLGIVHDGEARSLGLLCRGTRTDGDGDVLDPGIAHIERVRMALAAEADDGDALALDQIYVGIPVIINAHVGSSSVSIDWVYRKARDFVMCQIRSNEVGSTYLANALPIPTLDRARFTLFPVNDTARAPTKCVALIPAAVASRSHHGSASIRCAPYRAAFQRPAAWLCPSFTSAPRRARSPRLQC